MNTHIIIRIEDIEETNIVSAEKRDAAIVSLVRNSKQVSLDEKDIEEKAVKAASEIVVDKNGNPDKRLIELYKQALKDLL